MRYQERIDWERSSEYQDRINRMWELINQYQQVYEIICRLQTSVSQESQESYQLVLDDLSGMIYKIQKIKIASSKNEQAWLASGFHLRGTRETYVPSEMTETHLKWQYNRLQRRFNKFFSKGRRVKPFSMKGFSLLKKTESICRAIEGLNCRIKNLQSHNFSLQGSDEE